MSKQLNLDTRCYRVALVSFEIKNVFNTTSYIEMTLNARICLKSEILVYFLTYYVINVSKELCILKLMMIKVDLKHRKLVLLHF